MQVCKMLCWIGLHAWGAPHWLDNRRGWGKCCSHCATTAHVPAPSCAEWVPHTTHHVHTRRQSTKYQLVGPTLLFDD